MTKNYGDIIEAFKTFLSDYFGDHFDGRLSDQLDAVIVEIILSFEDSRVGGWSIYYCKVTWSDSNLETDADLEIFDLLLKIDIQNGADPSKIVNGLCNVGAFEAVKVRFRQVNRAIKKLLT